MNIFISPKILCAICASLTAVSKGAEFGFTSQLTYSLQHGYHKMEVTDVDISWIGIQLINIHVYPFYLNEITLGAALSLGCIIGFFVGGWMSQHLGKRIMMVVSNFVSFVIWIMLAFTSDKVEFIIIERFLMGVFSAAAIVCVGKLNQFVRCCHQCIQDCLIVLSCLQS